MKSIFYKSVRQGGLSLYATGKFQRRYEIGERYTFPEHLPAHVFLFEDCTFRFQFDNRAEPGISRRVLICWGEAKTRRVPVFEITRFRQLPWLTPDWEAELDRDAQLTVEQDTAEAWDSDLETRLCSTDFEVIGEIFYPTNMPHPGPVWGRAEWAAEIAPSELDKILARFERMNGGEEKA